MDDATLLRLLVTPERYDQKAVQIVGYLHLEFEGNCLYLHQDDFEKNIVGNMIWIDVTEDMKKQMSQINDRYVLISGVFDAKRGGHMGLSSGALTKIVRCIPWPSRKEMFDRHSEKE